jgi:hypothetical protein
MADADIALFSPLLGVVDRIDVDGSNSRRFVTESIAPVRKRFSTAAVAGGRWNTIGALSALPRANGAD